VATLVAIWDMLNSEVLGIEEMKLRSKSTI
jgi:hypothetical protein